MADDDRGVASLAALGVDDVRDRPRTEHERGQPVMVLEDRPVGDVAGLDSVPHMTTQLDPPTLASDPWRLDLASRDDGHGVAVVVPRLVVIGGRVRAVVPLVLPRPDARHLVARALGIARGLGPLSRPNASTPGVARPVVADGVFAPQVDMPRVAPLQRLGWRPHSPCWLGDRRHSTAPLDEDAPRLLTDVGAPVVVREAALAPVAWEPARSRLVLPRGGVLVPGDVLGRAVHAVVIGRQGAHVALGLELALGGGLDVLQERVGTRALGPRDDLAAHVP
ncbi:MAG: hypothetical protein CMB99_01165 [Flavobacteriaceae bacterium]|nr:hypothetical protein [Flavobacteriaceae bacterium]